MAQREQAALKLRLGAVRVPARFWPPAVLGSATALPEQGMVMGTGIGAEWAAPGAWQTVPAPARVAWVVPARVGAMPGAQAPVLVVPMARAVPGRLRAAAWRAEAGPPGQARRRAQGPPAPWAEAPRTRPLPPEAPDRAPAFAPRRTAAGWLRPRGAARPRHGAPLWKTTLATAGWPALWNGNHAVLRTRR